MVTIKDISRLANVSIASVSKVLNGDYSKVSDETKNRILQVSKELNYKPNRLARGLVNNRTNIVGLVIPDIANPYYAELARGVEDKADSYGYKVILCNTDADGKKEAAYIDVLIEYNVDGVLIAGNENSLMENIYVMQSNKTPFVSIERNLGDEYYNVIVDNFKGSYVATEHMIKCGHKRIAFIGGEGGTHLPHYRLDGYLKALEDYKLKADKDLICLGNYHVETGYNCTLGLLDKDMKFTAITCGNDLIAFGALNAIKERGLRVPQDISLVGYDDIYLTLLADPKLTTIKQPTYDLGSCSVDMLVRLMKKEDFEEHTLCFIPQLVDRDSVKRFSRKS